jgi:hypothetical protein
MVIAEAFFDESGTNDDDKNLCLGGYVFQVNAVTAFEADWRSMLASYGLQFFHMREFRQQGKGVFRHLTTEQREHALVHAITIIEKHAAFGFAFSIEKAHFDVVAQGSPWSKEYSFLANQTFYGIEQRFKGSEAGVVNYVERGAEGWGEAEAVFKDAKKQPTLEAQFRLGEFRRENKEVAVQLQAADLLVWSTLRERRRVDQGARLGQHEEFKRLRTVPLDVHHWDDEGGEMIQWLRQVCNDAAFLQWLREGGADRKFIAWLKVAGPIALDYFREQFEASR